jgi:hypothetical protein
MLKKLAAFLLTFFLVSASWGSVHAQSQDSKYFSETGHNVSGEFLSFYNANPNATFLYGYPITEQFTSKDGKTVQYFQRARFEYNASLPAGQRVKLSPLGRETYTSTGAVDVKNAAFACRQYSQTGFRSASRFWNFSINTAAQHSSATRSRGLSIMKINSCNISRMPASNGSRGNPKDSAWSFQTSGAFTLTDCAKTLPCLPRLSLRAIHQS